MTDEKVHNAVHADTLHLCGVDVRVYVTEDGQRILDLEDVNRLFDALMDKPDLTEEEALTFATELKGVRVMEQK